jgi:hypothetical protein
MKLVDRIGSSLSNHVVDEAVEDTSSKNAFAKLGDMPT